jgi:F420-dependent methylenetetrahydromethanopterin dehydrogenase
VCVSVKWWPGLFIRYVSVTVVNSGCDGFTDVTEMELFNGTVLVLEACGKVNVVVTRCLDKITELVRSTAPVVFIVTEDNMDAADKLIVLAGNVTVTR